MTKKTENETGHTHKKPNTHTQSKCLLPHWAAQNKQSKRQIVFEKKI